MTIIDPMANKTALESYLISTFSKIQDQYGQKLDISPAVPTLVEVLSGHVNSVKKYEFIGEAACQFGLRCILARTHSQMDDSILDALARKFRNLGQVNKMVIKEIGLKLQQGIKTNPNTTSLISGVLYTFFGTTAVEKFIENAVAQIAAVELGDATAKLKKQEAGPLSRLNELILKGSGHVEFSSQAVTSDNNQIQWQITLTARLNGSSQIFSHKRIESSMRKAKNLAASDVLTYFEKNPQEYAKLQVQGPLSNIVHPLPIMPSEYSVAEYQTTLKNTADKPKREDSSDYFTVSYTTDEDAIRKLSALLLGNPIDEDMSDEEGSPTKKRMRDGDQQQQQTGLNGMIFPTKTEPEDTQIKTEVIKSEIDYEETRQQLLASVSAEPAMEMQTDKVGEPVNITNTPAPTNPYAAPIPEINPRILHYFKTLFRNNRSTMGHAVGLPGQSKSIFLSIVIQHGDKVKCTSEVQQVGPPHAPVFSASVRLQSKEYSNVFIVTEATAPRKKDAECFAYHQLTIIFN